MIWTGQKRLYPTVWHGIIDRTTGSGKTTTMYSILKILNVRDRNIATIEDPVEYELEGVNQIQANPKTNLTSMSDYARYSARPGCSIRRRDPRQGNRAMTVNAAMTGISC